MYQDFLCIIEDFYSGLEYKQDDKLLDYLNKEESTERLFIKFNKIIKNLQSIEHINISNVNKLVASGRINFHAKINKNSWLGSDIADLVDGKYSVTENSYDVHIEPSFDVFHNKITLPLHYETRPYIPKKRLEANTNPQTYKVYLEGREEFKKLIHQKIYKLNDKNIKVYNGSNQIACVKININEETTIEEFIDLLREYIVVICNIVDSCFFEKTVKNK